MKKVFHLVQAFCSPFPQNELPLHLDNVWRRCSTWCRNFVPTSLKMNYLFIWIMNEDGVQYGAGILFSLPLNELPFHLDNVWRRCSTGCRNFVPPSLKMYYLCIWIMHEECVPHGAWILFPLPSKCHELPLHLDNVWRRCSTWCRHFVPPSLKMNYLCTWIMYEEGVPHGAGILFPLPSKWTTFASG